MSNIRWEKISDWDNSRDNPGVEHGNDPYTSSTPETLKQGYEKQWPPLTHGLVGWWPLHDTQARDLSGNGNHGTLNGGVTTGVAGRGGLQATSLGGSGDNIDFGNVFSGGEFTYTIWIRPRETTSEYDDTLGDGAARRNLVIDASDELAIRGYDGSENLVSGNTTISAGEWTFACVTYDGSTATLYVDGEEDGSGSWNTSDSGSEDGIGLRDNQTFTTLNGSVADARIYNRALTSAEIQTLYQMGSADLASPPNNGLAHYKLDGDATDNWNNNDGTGYTASFSENAIRGQAAFFDSDGGYDTGLSLPATFTASAWIRPVGIPYAGREYISTRSSSSGFAIRTRDSNQVQGYIYDSDAGSFTTLSTTAREKEWVHAVFVVNDENTASLYVNGRLEDSAEIGTRTIGTEMTLGTKPNQNSNHAYGYMDDVRIYDYALNPQQIQELYRYGTRGINLNKHTVMQ